MTVTTPEETTRSTDTDDECVHIRCELCDVIPLRAVCGEDLTGEDEVPTTSPLPYCPACNEVWELHKQVLHP